MGCTTSDYEWENSLIIRNITTENKQKLSDRIQINDLINLAIMMQDIEVYPNSEISQANMGWMLTHLCCRWDAHFCLEYLLRLYFMENPKGYLTFVNAQTAEGYTCINLCCIWNSVKCFQVLNNFGGLDLTLKDNKLKTVEQYANQYKSYAIAKILQNYKQQKIQFTAILTQKIMKGPLIPSSKQKKSEVQHKKNQLNHNNQLPQKPTQTQIEPKTHQNTHIIQQNLRQLQLQAQKNKLQKQLSVLLQRKLQKQLDYDTKIALIFILLNIQQYQKQQYRKKERQKLHLQLQKQQQLYIKQIEQKQQKIKFINIQLKRIEKDKLNHIKNLQMAKAQEILLKNNQLLIQKIKQKNQFLLEFKKQNQQNMYKQIESKVMQKGQNNYKNKTTDIPESVMKLYEQAKEIGIFTDIQFPASNTSIGDSSKSKYALFTQNTIWLRPRQIFKQDFKLFQGIDPDDIKQGSLGVCYMLATISALASNPKNIQKIFVFADIDIGFYVLKLYVNGIPKYFVVDDLIPCCKTTKSPYFTQPIGKEIWVLLLEKAWAKLIGSYLSAQSMTPDHMMQDLSGAPAYGWWLSKQNAKTPTQKIKQIIKHCTMGHIVVITSIPDKKLPGIVNNHAYSLLQVIEYNHRYIFKIRNPWGRFEWEGQFGQNSSLCTEDFKKKVSLQNKDDGIFYISQNQLLKAFCFYSISHIKPDYFYSHIKFQSKKNQNVYFKFKITKSSQVNLRIVQPFDRIVNNRNYKYSPMLFQIGKIINKNQMIFISQGHQRTYFGAKSVHAFQDIFQFLQQGQYFLRIKMLWDWQQKYNSAALACYASQQVQIQQIDINQGEQLLKNLFFAFMKPYNKIKLQNGFYKIATMKGQFLFLAQTQPEQQNQFKVTFKFNKQKMLNTQTQIGKISPTQLQTVIDKKRYGICTATRIQPAQGGTTGPVLITFTKI